ncbi:MAG: PTS sugar transporter subunit IIA [Alphaproteobacteria bacterium]|nr:PTS sugar transporter subunit IIA [Alphaproteobacteria bacterium]
MIGIVIVTHGKLANEFQLAAEHVVGKQPQIGTVCIGPKDDAEESRRQILAAVKEADSGKGVIILTDMFGGTPSNLAISLMGKGEIEVIAGINLPMLIKLVSVRKETPLRQAALLAQEAGRKYINVASNLFAARKTA